MLRKVAICALVASALIVTGCGGSDNSSSAEDEQAIQELVAKLNQATADKDASEFCLIMQPSAVDETFHDIDRCVSETKSILKTAGDQPKLTVESIEVDGDVATVQFSGTNGGEAQFVKEDGQWYVPLNTGDASGSSSTPDSSGDEG